MFRPSGGYPRYLFTASCGGFFTLPLFLLGKPSRSLIKCLPAMSPEIREIIDNDKFYLGSVRAVAERLPADDGELDQWIAEAVSTHDQGALHFLVCAAALIGRPIGSHHLRAGFSMLTSVHRTICLIWKMQGDVPADLLHAVRHTALAPDMHAMALLAIQAWCAEHREGVCPPDLVTEARLLAHDGKNDPIKIGCLWGLSDRLKDPRLEAILVERCSGRDLAGVRKAGIDVANAFLTFTKGTIDIFLVAEDDRRITTSGPLRRAVGRIGRNDPCSCGSGKKYKRCCEDKDKERLRHSSTVAGMTAAEVKARPEEQLTPARLEKMTGHDIARLNPALVKPDLHREYLVKLTAFKLLDEAVAAFETIGCHDEDVADVWHFTLFWITQKQRLDLARRMLALRCQHGPADDRLKPAARLLLCSDDPPRYLEMLEHLCGEAVRTANDNFCQDLTCGLLYSPLRALGILVARSYLPLGSKKNATFILEEIQRARDRLDLPHEEPFTDILEKRLNDTSQETGAEAAALQKSRRLLAEKAAEIRDRNEKLAQIQRDIRRHEKQLPAATASTPKTDAEQEALRTLREKLAATSASLRAANEERTVLRRQAMEAITQAEAERAKQPAPAAPSSDDETSGDDSALTLPGGIDSHQLPRPIDFPRRFHATLSHLPTQIGRAAMILIGRIAAGESAAFTGVVRLRAAPDVLRVRIGRDHRLLFRLHPDRVELVDLINRRDLERRIEKL